MNHAVLIVMMLTGFDCEELHVPLNGAMACSGWAHGLTCQMMCNSAYDIPRTAPADGQYVCSDTVGEWGPHDIVPDCTGNVAMDVY